MTCCLDLPLFLFGLALILFWFLFWDLKEDFDRCGWGGRAGPNVCRKSGCGVVEVVAGNKVPAVGKKGPIPEPSSPTP